MSARRDRGGLWSQVDQLLQRRPGWSFQASATPGAPPVWCFGPERDPDLSVMVDKAVIRIYEPQSGREVVLGSTEELLVWLQAERPGSLKPQKGRVADKLKRAKFFEWE